MPTIVVTGATGTVGSRLVAALGQSPGVTVRAAVRKPGLALPPAVVPVDFDWTRPDTMAAALSGADRLFLLTPLSPDSVEYGKRCIDAAVAAGVRHVVKLSTSGAEQVPGILMGRWHREVEVHAEASGVPYTCLRPGSFMNNYGTYFRADPAGNVYLPLGDGATLYVDARDIADVAAAVLTGDGHAGQVYTLTGPEALTAAQACEHLSRASGRTIRFVDVPPEASRDAMLGMGAPTWMVDGMLELFAIMKAGWTAGVTPSVLEITGHAPRTFADFARDHAGAWRA